MKLEENIEALLFAKGEPLSVSFLAKLLEREKKEIIEAAQNLKKNLTGRGLVLIEKDDTFSLATSKDTAPFVEKLFKEEETGSLSRASLETLTVILYRAPIAKPDIDWVRGVNSQFTLRNLILRGLIERISNQKDGRSYLYRPTVELMSHVGITKISDLPEFENYNAKIDASLTAKEETNESA